MSKVVASHVMRLSIRNGSGEMESPVMSGGALSTVATLLFVPDAPYSSVAVTVHVSSSPGSTASGVSTSVASEPNTVPPEVHS